MGTKSGSAVLRLIMAATRERDGLPAIIELDEEQKKSYKLGRSATADFRLDGTVLPSLISRHHATIKLEQDTGKWMIVDEGSLNGVFINGAKIESKQEIELKVRENRLWGGECSGEKYPTTRRAHNVGE